MPPPGHPFFDALTAAQTELCQKTMRVTVDGALALERDIPFYDAASLQPSIGTSGDRPVASTHPFSGRYPLMGPPPHRPGRFRGRDPLWSLKAQFPDFTWDSDRTAREFRRCPAGETLVFVRYLGAGQALVRLRSPGHGRDRERGGDGRLRVDAYDRGGERRVRRPRRSRGRGAARGCFSLGSSMGGPSSTRASPSSPADPSG